MTDMPEDKFAILVRGTETQRHREYGVGFSVTSVFQLSLSNLKSMMEEMSKTSHRRLCTLCLLLVGTLFGPPLGAAESPDSKFVDGLRPVLLNYCQDCHGPDDQAGGFRVDELPPSFEQPQQFADWLTVFRKLKAGEMPPPGERTPAEAG